MSRRHLVAPCGSLVVEDDGVLLRARGIPYASAQRFAPPIPAVPHTDALDATKRGAACPQLPSRLESVTGLVIDRLEMSERCHVVSVTAPSDADGLPVMVWFHGGAYVSGSGEAPKYDPDALVGEGRVVVVTVSYRLGIFGYLNPVVGGEDNLGLRDQMLALRWTRENIAAFGGDPTRVTIFGQSAGGDSVMNLLLCNDASGLFQRAILQSAPLGLRSGRDAMTTAMRAAVAEKLSGVAPAEASVEQLLEAQKTAFTTAQRFGPVGGFPFAPIPGIYPLPPTRDMDRRLADAAQRVEILAGYARDDANAFVAMNPRANRLARLGSVGRVAARPIVKAMTKRIFGDPARDLAKLWRANGGEAANFRVDWAPPGAPLGPCHCIELPLLLGSPGAWADAPMLGPTTHPIDERLARRVRRYWSGFAHDGITALGGSSLRI